MYNTWHLNVTFYNAQHLYYGCNIIKINVVFNLLAHVCLIKPKVLNTNNAACSCIVDSLHEQIQAQSLI